MLFYIVLLMLVGHYKISFYPELSYVFNPREAALVLPPPAPLPPPEQDTRQPQTKALEPASAPGISESGAKKIAADTLSAFQTSVATPTAAPEINPALTKLQFSRSPEISRSEIARLRAVYDFQRQWKVMCSGRYTQAEFTVYQARCADGDWYCNSSKDRDGRAPNFRYWEDLNNLLLQIRAWSQNRLKADLHPEVLDVGSDEIFTIKPPFVYLTGHKDFHFSDKEVKKCGII